MITDTDELVSIAIEQIMSSGQIYLIFKKFVMGW